MSHPSHTNRKRLALLGLGILALGLCCFALARHKRQYAEKSEAHLRQLKKAGKPLTIADVARNYDAALTELNSAQEFLEIFELLPAKFEEYLPKRGLISQELAGRITERNLDKDPLSFALDERLTPSARANLSAFLQTNSSLFSRVQQLTNKTSVRFQYNWSEGTDMRLPRLSRIKTLARVIEARCLLYIEDGKTEDAIEDIKLLFRISESLDNEVIIISQLVRARIRRIAMACQNRLLCQVQLASSQLIELRRCLGNSPIREKFARALEAERAFFLDHFQNPLPEEAAPGSSSWHVDRWIFLSTFQDIIEAFAMPEHETIPRIAIIEQNLDRELRVPQWRVLKLLKLERKRGVLSGSLLPAFFGVGNKVIAEVAEERLTKLAIAIELYRLERGSLPQDLSALGEPMPHVDLIDPFTGKMMVFRPSSDHEWIIYSLGRNLTDEGGEGIRPRKPVQPLEGNWESGRDIVFPVSAKNRR